MSKMEKKNVRKDKELFRSFFNNIDEDIILENIIGDNKENYFDHTASGLAFGPIEERLQDVLKTYANIHSNFSTDAKLTSEYYDMAKKNLRKQLQLNREFALLTCGVGATGAIKKFQELIGIYIPPETRKKFNFEVMSVDVPLVIVGPFEHHSNEVSYRESICDVIRVPLNRNGNINMKFLERTLEQNSHRKIIGSFSIASNVTGVLLPYERISKLFRKYSNTIIAYDNAAASPCLNIPNEMYDAMFVSPHKLIGGPGSCGLLAIRKSLVDKDIPPSFAGGGTVTYVSKDQHEFHSDIETREEAGTAAILQLIKASLAYQLRNEIGLENIQKKKVELFKVLKEGLSMFEGCTIYGQSEESDSIGILSLNFDGVTPFELCERLSSEYGIQTRAGCSCAGPYGHDLMGIKKVEDEKEIPSWLRISINYTHSVKNVKYLLFALNELLEDIKKGKQNEQTDNSNPSRV